MGWVEPHTTVRSPSLMVSKRPLVEIPYSTLLSKKHKQWSSIAMPPYCLQYFLHQPATTLHSSPSYL
ncbi:hypothetical protein E2C01_086436 [Portunus trituberculatus]|uniref:Uncharacterized protein n=1 Tax=Portunus trituberculatus TaxID=210409 RepID=A0A5B7J0S8_PORTR|nr:hypothetical protein [Portunus trituberculatus]